MSSSAYADKHRKLGLCINCIKPVVQGSKIFCSYHREKDRARGRIKEKRLGAQLKIECFQHYGNICKCCGESNIYFLTLDHILGNGNIHRKKIFKHNVGGVHMYRWLKKNNFPEGYTILCMNCNWATRYGGICPHKDIGGVA